MSNFYQSISTYYDKIFPYNSMQETFITQHVGTLAGKRLLDAGCGTGSLALSIGQKDAIIDAFDLDDSMIAFANKKKPQTNANIQFSVANLMDVATQFEAKTYDFAYCFGNTVAHLDTLEEVEHFIKGISNVLKTTNASFALQIVNYDRIIQQNVEALPTIDNDELFFTRAYKQENGKINFLTTLGNKETGESVKSSQLLTPIAQKDLVDITAKYFDTVDVFGSFKGEAWTTNSFHTIILGSR